jgi:hypothetical protein
MLGLFFTPSHHMGVTLLIVIESEFLALCYLSDVAEGMKRSLLFYMILL